MGISFTFTGISAAKTARLKKGLFTKLQSDTIKIPEDIKDADVTKYFKKLLNAWTHENESKENQETFTENYTSPL